NTHYVALEFGIYGYKPYPVSETLARRFGDCKDKASLMVALLRGLGIDADLALVRTRHMGALAPQPASIAVFDHAIVYLPKYDLWLDGTAEYAGSRELPIEDQGAMALVVSLDGRAELRQVPRSSAADNLTRRVMTAVLRDDGTIHFHGRSTTRGEDAPGLRREYEQPDRQRDSLRDRLAEVYPSVRIDDVNVQGARDYEHDVTVDFDGTLDAFAGRKLVSLQVSWMPRHYVQSLAPLASRREPLELPAPWTTAETISFELPSSAVAELPPDVQLDQPFASATLHFAQSGRRLVLESKVEFRQTRIAAGDYAQFRQFCSELERAFRRQVQVRLP
ncbi:MAG TPA: transglutaminase-like domain-containing protein, partial [Usitatibacter sp.]|nr:transglutaminase-like domain-containing protein [Usitatibacter sp.]